MSLTTFRIICFVSFTILINCSASDAQCAEGNNVIVGNEPCNYSIVATPYFFTDETFQTKIAVPIRVLSGDFLYMSVFLNSTSLQANNLLLETCWATKQERHLTRIINETVVDFPGCPARRWRSVITMNNNGRRDVVTIRFPIFFLFPDEPEFYLHCSVGACGNCEPNDCDSSVEVPQTFTRTAGIITIGPIQRTDFEPDSSTAEPNTTGFLIAACVLAGFAFLIIVAVLLYCCCSSSKRKQTSNDASNASNAPVLIIRKELPVTLYSESSSYRSATAPSAGTIKQNIYTQPSDGKPNEMAV